MSNIIRMEPRHTGDVARLHLAYLPTRFTGLAGYHLLRLYYRNLSLANSAVGYVAEESRQVVGYICGIWDRGSLQQSLKRRYWPELLFWGAVQIFTHPALLLPLVKRGSGASTKAEEGYEVRPMVVAPSERRKGLAQTLSNTIQADARSRGFDRTFLFTEEFNVPSNNFHRKMGYYEANRVIRGDTTYIRYERPTD